MRVPPIPRRLALAGVALACLISLAHGQPQAQVKGASPMSAVRPADTFVAGPGDTLRVTVFQNQDLTLEVRVDADGRITYPFLGLLQVGGRTPSEIETLIARGLEERQVLKRPQVSVTMPQFRSQQIAVLGNVNRPGKYPLELPLTVSDALALAGGLTQLGGDSVVLSRIEDGKTRNIEIDLAQMFVPGAGRMDDLALRPGDVIFAHRYPVFYIYGEVQRPGAFRLERQMTLMQALSTGGGITLRGTERGIRVTRRDAQGKTYTVEADLATKLEADDVIYVRESMF